MQAADTPIMPVIDLGIAARWAERTARRTWSADPVVDQNDLTQTAILGVLEHIADYAPDLCPVSAFVTMHARWALWRDRVYRSKHAVNARRSIHATNLRDRGVAWDLPDTESAEALARMRARQDARVLTDRLLRCPKLTSRDRALLAARYGLDGSAPTRGAELALRFGVSQARVNQLLSRALEQLRRHAHFQQLDPAFA